MKLHTMHTFTSLKDVKESPEKPLSGAEKNFPSAFKTVLMSAAAEELPAAKNVIVQKSGDEESTENETPDNGKQSKSSIKSKKQEIEDEGGGAPLAGNKITASFYSPVISGAINEARTQAKPSAEANSAAAKNTASEGSGYVTAVKQQQASPAQHRQAQDSLYNSRQQDPVKGEIPETKTAAPVTSILVTSSKQKNSDNKSDDAPGQNSRENIFKTQEPAQQSGVKQASLPQAGAPGTSERAQEIIKTMGKQLRASFEKPPVKGVEYTAVVKLSPPSLGSMEIKTVMKADKSISVKITASRADTISMLTSNADSLKHELSGVFQGSAGQLDVNVGAQDMSGQNYSNTGAEQNNGGEEIIYQDGVYNHAVHMSAGQPAANAEKNSYMV